MGRVECEADLLGARSREVAGSLVAFTGLSRRQVAAHATHGPPIPAGITRHILLNGRALRVNLPLATLDAKQTIDSANDALSEHPADLHPRFYREPTLLFDS